MAKKSATKASRDKTSVAKKKSVRAKKAAPKVAGKKSANKKKAAPSLGRPKVTGEEQLYMLFHDDFHSRQVFDFLRVQTVKELEQYSPQQIVKLLSRPITESVNRIRRKLAEKNRHLRDDLEFAVEFQDQVVE